MRRSTGSVLPSPRWYCANRVQVVSVRLQQQLVQATRAQVDVIRKKVSPFCPLSV